jgi:hypothetical protein
MEKAMELMAEVEEEEKKIGETNESGNDFVLDHAVEEEVPLGVNKMPPLNEIIISIIINIICI